MSQRVAVLAFDSPDLRLLETGLAEGRLPVLASLVSEGRFVELRQNQELVTSASWQTLLTGTTLDAHELLYVHQLDPGTYNIVPMRVGVGGRPPFWRFVSDAGLESTILSPYGAPLLDDFRGTQVGGWGTHDGFWADRRQSDPPALWEELEREFGPRTIRYGISAPEEPDALRAYAETVRRGTDQQGAAARALAERTDWDLYSANFGDCHQAGHWLWHLDMPEHPLHEGSPEDLRGSLLDIYARTDAAIGSVIDVLPDDTSVFVISPYTMGPNHQIASVMPEVLTALGFQAHRGDEGGPAIKDRRLRALAIARRAVHLAVPGRLRPRLGRLVPRDRLVGALALADMDWQRTRAFVIPGDGTFLRLNVAGREPEGIVQPGADYDQTCGEIADALMQLRDADTGDRLAVDVKRFDELYGREVFGAMPDLCIRWAHLARLRAIAVPGHGEVPIRHRDKRKSLHWEPGFVVARGPGIEPSGSTALSGPSARLVDVAPTILAHLEVGSPPAFSGEPIAALAPRREAAAERTS